MLQENNMENGLNVNLCNLDQKFSFDELESQEEIRLVPISSGMTLEQLGQVIYESNNKRSASSVYNLLNMKCYNNVNRARYAFLN